MRLTLCLINFLILVTVSNGQPALQPAVQQLKEYEGVYQYLNDSTLEIAVSPRDRQLYAIINQGKYPLKAVSKDVFLDAAGSRVEFRRSRSGLIEGYSVNGQQFDLLKKGEPSKQVWFARTPANSGRYTYKKSLIPKLNDGIEIGSIGSSGLNKKNIQDMVDRIVSGTYADVHSVLLLRNNKLVVEEYFYEYNRNTLHEMRSATKSVISALIGIALGKGIINSIDDPILSFFPEYTVNDSSGRKKSITIRHLLTNQSGFDCDISLPTSAGNEKAMGASSDWVKFTLDLPIIDTPGTHGRYCSGNAIVLGRILEKITGMDLDEFARENLFKPLGVSQFKWNFKPDQSSAETFCQLYMRPRDMAKFGLLYLNNGKWKDKQIIPPGWVKESLSYQSMIGDTEYGYLWWRQWLNVFGTRYNGIAAKGNGGQRIYLFPEYNLLAVITGGSYNTQSPSDAMLINHVLLKLQ